jgi:hypothetical protein
LESAKRQQKGCRSLAKEAETKAKPAPNQGVGALPRAAAAAEIVEETHQRQQHHRRKQDDFSPHAPRTAPESGGKPEIISLHSLGGLLCWLLPHNFKPPSPPPYSCVFFPFPLDPLLRPLAKIIRTKNIELRLCPSVRHRLRCRLVVLL